MYIFLVSVVDQMRRWLASRDVKILLRKTKQKNFATELASIEGKFVIQFLLTEKLKQPYNG